MNLVFALGLIVAWGASCAGAFFYGAGVGEDRVEATNAVVERAMRDATAESRREAAKAISEIEVKNVTINRRLETKVRTEKVFADCRSGDDAVRLFNSAIPAGAGKEPARRGELPAADAARR